MSLATLTFLAACLLAETPATQKNETASARRGRADAFCQALELTGEQATALGTVGDYSRQFDEAAFYMLLAKTAEIGSSENQPAGVLDRAAIGNLLNYPDRYRGRPIRLGLRVKTVEKLQVGQGLTASQYWAADRPVWKLGCLGEAGSAYDETPLIVFCTVEPSTLGKPGKASPEGEQIFYGNRHVEMDGFFYKVMEARNRTGVFGYFPVVLAWRMEPASAARTGPASPGLAPNKMVMGVAGLLILYFFVRRYARRASDGAAAHHYRPSHPQDAQKRLETNDGENASKNGSS